MPFSSSLSQSQHANLTIPNTAINKPSPKSPPSLCFASSAVSTTFLFRTVHRSIHQRLNSKISMELGQDLTPLQKHVAFFDRNHDGVVYPWETFQGFRAIGASLALSTISAFLINASLSHKTRPGKFPSLLFPIEIANIKRAKHGSDSGVYDSEGRFVPLKFEEIFGKHAKSNSDALTGEELKAMLKANREPKNYNGWLASYAEWQTLYSLCKGKDGLIHKDTIQALYDGSLFDIMAKETASSSKKMK